jgi:phosphotransferase system HPr (HPr) family protein
MTDGRANSAQTANGVPQCTPDGGAASVLRRVVRIMNPLGLHHRVADRFARTAGMYDAKIVVRNGDLSADGKSLWDLMMLLAFEGTDVVLELEGPEAAQALEPLAAILAARGGEDYNI